ncbi:hypothetical protein [Enterocloster citroniae]|uniref:Gas vesicle protein n=2 Tax=Enterocloster citroniae TaxID=358743 RepID=A0ABV2G4K7_9FIRM|nr:hypothetical protein [Enterocloster citroniae]KMW10429.1 hypothetical protein HMPREF9470_05571 [[Clostridium] citroniae WAL-19142]
MASVKISVDSLNQQKREYEKAVRNLDNALEQIKKVNRSLGKDAMLEGARTALTKLSASLETRSGVLLLMIKALEQSGDKYTASQKKAVAKSNQFRAHHRDFYGNPVVVTAAATATAATATAAATAAASGADSSIHIKSQNAETVSPQTDSGVRPAVYTERGSGSAISQVSEHARNTAAPKADVAGASKAAAEPVSMGSMDNSPVKEGAVTGAADTGSSGPGANVFAAGAAAAGAAIGGIAGGAVGALVKPEQKKTKTTHKKQEVPTDIKTKPEQQKTKLAQEKQEPSTDIERQLEAARERLRQLNEMEERE